MVYKSIVVIGIGTLGGFVADALANLETLETLIVIDHDTVEAKNLINSIYRQIDLGVQKTEALTDIISTKNPDVTVITLNEKFIEGKTKIPQCDLVLDCRDYTYDRRKEIDVRLYMSSRYLMVDCRKNVAYKVKTEGKYLVELTKQDLRYAGTLVSMLVYNKAIGTLIKEQSVQKYELDYVKRIDKNSCDIVYESDRENKFVNLPDKILPILQANKQSDLELFVGSHLFPIAQQLIPKNSLQSSSDIAVSLTRAVSKQCEFNHFVVALHQTNGKFLLELIPETGAA